MEEVLPPGGLLLGAGIRGRHNGLFERKSRRGRTKTVPSTHENTVLFLPPVDVRLDRALRPYKTEDGSLNAKGVELPQRRRCRHTVLSVGNLQDLLLGFLVFPEATGDFESRSSWQLRTQRALPFERRSTAVAAGIVRLRMSGQDVERGLHRIRELREVILWDK